MSRLSVSIATAVAFTTLSLAGCGGGDEQKPAVSAPSAEQSDPIAAAKTAASKAESAASEAAKAAQAAGSDAMQAAKETGEEAMQAAKQTGADAMQVAQAKGSEAIAAAKAKADAMTGAMSGVPSGSLRGDAANGAELYAKYCVSCHGPGGKGDGPVGKTLKPPPADHTNTAYFKTLSDEHLYKVIDKGGAAVGKSPLMAPWGGIVKEQGVKDLVAHTRKLSGT